MTLNELMARAVASSDDRPAWLSARAGGITATEVRDLRTGQINTRALSTKKREMDFEDLSHVRHIAHGNNREPVIAEWIARRFNIQPNNMVFAARSNPRYLATPDGIGTNFDEELLISEIKTSKYGLGVDDPHFDTTGYWYQIQFQLFVTGAKRCLFVWEQHDDDWSEWPDRAPRPIYSEPEFRWVERDELEIERLIDLANAFLFNHDKAAPEGEPDHVLASLAARYIRTQRAEASFTKAKREIWDALHAHLHHANADTYRPDEGLRVTWTPGRTEPVLVPDPDAARAADPGLYAMMQEATLAWNDHLAKFQREELRTKAPQLRITETEKK